MTTLLIQLQAAVGLGIILYKLAIIVLVVVFPIILITTSVRKIREDKEKGLTLDKKTYINAVKDGFTFGVVTIVIIALVVFIIIYLLLDSSNL